MANKYTFVIPINTETVKWVNGNLDGRGFVVNAKGIEITYYNVMQKNDILKAIPTEEIK